MQDDCSLNVCGDGVVLNGAEACDDGNDVDDDACTNGCQLPDCGDGIVQEGEACDDGNDDFTDGCTMDAAQRAAVTPSGVSISTRTSLV